MMNIGKGTALVGRTSRQAVHALVSRVEPDGLADGDHNDPDRSERIIRALTLTATALVTYAWRERHGGGATQPGDADRAGDGTLVRAVASLRHYQRNRDLVEPLVRDAGAAAVLLGILLYRRGSTPGGRAEMEAANRC